MIRSISYGGGVQSTAMIVLAVQGKIDAEVALFANVGDDSEHPASLRYVRDVMQPWAERHGFPVHELRYAIADGTHETLMARKTGRRLSDAITVAQDTLWDEDDDPTIGETGCDEGVCFV